MALATLIWSHAAASLLYLALAAWQIRLWRFGVQQRLLGLAFAATGAWALSVALGGPGGAVPQVLESLRNLAFLGFMFRLLWRGLDDPRRPMLVSLYVVVALVVVAGIVVELAPLDFAGSPRILAAFASAHLALRMMAAVAALVLVHNLYVAAVPEARWGIRLAMTALAAMWAYDLNLDTFAYLDAGWSRDLIAARGLVMAAIAPLFALAARRNQRWRLQLSRAATFQSLSLLAVGGYFIAMVAATRTLRALGQDYVHLAQFLFVFLALLGAMVALPSSRFRAMLKVQVAKHLFRHRYDYREEWLRFTDTLGTPGEGPAPLDQRVIKALADITESPGGALMLPDAASRLALAARWQWPGVDDPASAEPALAHHLERTARILELDLLRRDDIDLLDEAALLPGWMLDDERLWALVPLIHGERLAGVVLLTRPRISRMLDWEDFDLLRVAGRQVASHLAEAQGQEALSDARRFDEFNRRFAFIIHDVKNLVSQLSLLARNAERHADNPAFRADMVATLKGSVEKMNDLLARLSQHNKGRLEEPRPVPLRAFAERIVARFASQHAVRLLPGGEVEALADPARLEQACVHLLQNAIDASPPGEPVWLSVERRGFEAVIVLLDRGCGMSPEFLRTRLFKPFASTKEGGFGIGAFEARAIVAAMGGRIEVESREGEGSRFAIHLPLAESLGELMEAAQ